MLLLPAIHCSLVSFPMKSLALTGLQSDSRKLAVTAVQGSWLSSWYWGFAKTLAAIDWPNMGVGLCIGMFPTRSHL